MTLILLFSFLLIQMQKLLIYANYVSNKAYYAQELCVNKDEPESCCEGKCELKKELDAIDSQSGDNVNTEGSTQKETKVQKFEKAEELFTGVQVFHLNTGQEITIVTLYQQTTSNGFLTKLVWPPKA
ncbi:MAG: hypothetical protein QM534_07980 [Sediminibacterium sp.]|nr:hypothetical protein [Sediminibacterium sp.]